VHHCGNTWRKLTHCGRIRHQQQQQQQNWFRICSGIPVPYRAVPTYAMWCTTIQSSTQWMARLFNRFAVTSHNMSAQRSGHKVLGSGVLQATPLPPSIVPSFLPFRGLLWVWTDSAYQLPNILIQFIQSKSIINLHWCLMNVLQNSACMQSSAFVDRTETMDYRPRIAAWH